jgi:hypothetical protein
MTVKFTLALADLTTLFVLQSPSDERHAGFVSFLAQQLFVETWEWHAAVRCVDGIKST